MPSAPILTLCDALVGAIREAWQPGEPDNVERVYIAPVTADDLPTLLGRRVYVFPGRYTDEPATRGEDLSTYSVGVLIVERILEPGPPTNQWMDDRVDFVEGTIADALDYDGRSLLRIGTREIWTESIDTETFNLEMLNQANLFWSELEVVLKEIA